MTVGLNLERKDLMEIANALLILVVEMRKDRITEAFIEPVVMPDGLEAWIEED
jgi:hypothetical protein